MCRQANGSFLNMLFLYSIIIWSIGNFFVIDSNTNGNQVNYKVVRKLCKKNSIEFKNQSFVSLINQLKDVFLMM